MNRPAGCIIKLLGFIVLVGILTSIAVYIVYQQYLEQLRTPADPNGDPVTFVVEDGWSLYKTALELENNGLIKDHRILKIYSRLSSDPVVVKSGEYLISPSTPPVSILGTLMAGDVITYSITFPEGLTVTEMARRWETSGYGTEAAFLNAIKHYRHARISYPETGWEGYLFPDTYVFNKPFNENVVIDMMINRLERVLRREWLVAAAEVNLNKHQVLTLASLIEKETRVDAERPLVSSVFHNRLNKRMLLQCDPTVIYAMGDQYQGQLLRKHLSFDSPYNTYVYPGLPPGPIGAPGEASIEAACFPADSRYFYFVANSGGGHTFSRTLAEHNRAVQRYRKWLRSQ
jgi:UPF0755 protein